MGRVIGRGIKTSQENIELIKQELEVAQKAGVELINKNTELENKLKATEVKSVGRSTSKAE